MNVYYDKTTGAVVYRGPTGLPKGRAAEYEESDWRHTLGPRGLNGNEIEMVWVDEDDPAVVTMLLEDELEIILQDAEPRVRSKGKRPPPAPLPEAVQRRNAAPGRLTALRKKGAAALTPAERNEVLDLMMLERTPPHELENG